MGKSGLSVFVLSLSVTVVTACGNTIPDPYGSYAGAPITGYGVAGQTVAGSGIANGGDKIAVGGNATTSTAGRATGTGGKIASGGKTTTGAGGKVGTGTGGKAAAGGTGIGGKTGTGGAAGKTGTGGSGATSDFFPKAYNSSCASRASHLPGTGCKDGGCHREFLAAGTVYKTGGSTGAANVEVGIKSGTTFLYGCSDSGGNFIFRSGGAVQWANADIRIRTSNGEKKKINPVNNGNCNTAGCHDQQLRLMAP